MKMVYSKWTRVSSRLSGKKVITSAISLKNSTSPIIAVARNIKKPNLRAPSVKNKPTIVENSLCKEELPKTAGIVPSDPPENGPQNVELELLEEIQSQQPDGGGAGESNHPETCGWCASSIFMGKYQKVDIPTYHQFLSQKFSWPPTEGNFQSCKYCDDDNCSVCSFNSDECPHGRCPCPTAEKCIDANCFENILIVNIDGCTAVEDIRKEFPTATRIYLEDMSEINSKSLFSATVQFASVDEALNKFNESGLKKIGRKTMEWVRCNEIKIENLPPMITKHELKRMFPFDVKRIELRPNQRQAIIKFRTAEQACQAYKSSFLFPLGDRALGWITNELRAKMKINTSLASIQNHCSVDSDTDCTEKTGSDIDDDTIQKGVRELTANRMTSACSGKFPNNRSCWQAPNYCKRTAKTKMYTSNVGTMVVMPRPKVYVSRLPKDVTLKTVRKIFSRAIKIDIEDWKSGKLAIVEFDSTIGAAKACYTACRVKIGGQFIKVSPQKPYGFRRMGFLTSVA